MIAAIGNDSVAAKLRRASQDLVEGEEKEEKCYVDVAWLISVFW